jgi:nicotinic acid mononucleotide adenylyltransferase
VYFGAFDPIHENHIAVARHTMRANGIKTVYLVPNMDNPFKPFMTPLSGRLELVRERLQEDDCAGIRVYPVPPEQLLHWAGRAQVCQQILRASRQEVAEQAGRPGGQQQEVEMYQVIGQDSIEETTAAKAFSSAQTRATLAGRTLLVFPRTSPAPKEARPAGAKPAPLDVSDPEAGAEATSAAAVPAAAERSAERAAAATASGGRVRIPKPLSEDPNVRVLVTSGYRDPTSGLSSTKLRQSLAATEPEGGTEGAAAAEGGSASAEGRTPPAIPAGIHPAVWRRAVQRGTYAALPPGRSSVSLALLGGPGAGKSTLCCELCRRMRGVLFVSRGEFHRTAAELNLGGVYNEQAWWNHPAPTYVDPAGRVHTDELISSFLFACHTAALKLSGAAAVVTDAKNIDVLGSVEGRSMGCAFDLVACAGGRFGAGTWIARSSAQLADDGGRLLFTAGTWM